MLLKVRAKGEKVFPSHIRGSMAYECNVILVARALTDRALYVEAVRGRLGSYEPPPILSGKAYFYEVIRVQPEYSKFLECIALQVQEKVLPLFKNKNLTCDSQVSVVVER